MKIAVVGATGLLGTDIVNVLKDEHEIIALNSSLVDIRNLDKVYSFVKSNKPDLIINCAAITDVDRCEVEKENAYLVNTIGPKNLAIAARDFNVRLFHISTDYVFDGKKSEPYTEFDTPSPVNTYGKTKLAGEEYIKIIHNNFIIIRTAWIFGEKRRHFVDYVVDGIKKQDEVIAVKDMVSSPTYSLDLARQICKLINTQETGIFHITNKGYCSRAELVEEIVKIMKKSTNIKVVNQSQWRRNAKRPVFSALQNYHLSLIDMDDMPGWRDALKRYLKTQGG